MIDELAVWGHKPRPSSRMPIRGNYRVSQELAERGIHYVLAVKSTTHQPNWRPGPRIP